MSLCNHASHMVDCSVSMREPVRCAWDCGAVDVALLTWLDFGVNVPALRVSDKLREVFLCVIGSQCFLRFGGHDSDGCEIFLSFYKVARDASFSVISPDRASASTKSTNAVLVSVLWRL